MLRRLLILLLMPICIACSSSENAETKKAAKQRVKENTFAIGRDGTWFPLELYGKEKYLLVFVDELLKEFASLKSQEIALFPVTYSDMFQQLDRGTYEGIISTRLPTDKAKEKYLFSRPIIHLGPVLVVPKDSSATAVADLQGLVLLVPEDQELIVEVSKSPSIIINTYSNVGDALDTVRRGRADGVLVPALAGYTYTHGLYKNDLKVVTPPLTEEALRLIVRANDPRSVAFVQKFDQSLRTLKENGVYYYLRRKWRLEESFE